MSVLRSANEMLEISEQNYNKLDGAIQIIKDQIIERMESAALLGFTSATINLLHLTQNSNIDEIWYKNYIIKNKNLFVKWLEDAGYKVKTPDKSSRIYANVPDSIILEIEISWINKEENKTKLKSEC